MWGLKYDNSRLNADLDELKTLNKDLQDQTLKKQSDDHEKQLAKELKQTRLLLNMAREDAEKYRLFFEQFDIDAFSNSLQPSNSFFFIGGGDIVSLEMPSF